MVGLGGCGLALDLDPPERAADGGSLVACATEADCPVDACSGPPACVRGVCRYAERLVCDDGVGCTASRCDPVEGCVYVPRDGRCDDGVECTRDTCDVERGCVHEPDDGACADEHRCTRDVCTVGGCVHQPDDALCGLSTCDPLSGCVGTECTLAEHCPAAPCEVEATCEEGRCVAGGVREDGAPCDDGDACTESSECRDGACVGVTFVTECAVACALCDRESGGGCEAPVAAPDGTTCDDGNACTGPGSCSEGACSPGLMRACPARPCQRSVGCDPATGCLFEPRAAGTPCAVADLCMVGSCDGSGTCVSEPRDCGPSSTCDPGTGACACLGAALLCGGRCCTGTCMSGVCVADDGSVWDGAVVEGGVSDGSVLEGGTSDASVLDAGGPTDAATDAPSDAGSTGADDAGGPCGTLGMACVGSGTCGTEYECDPTYERCVPEAGRPGCGGFAGATCETSPYLGCVFYVGADYGPCLTETEASCVCTGARDLFVCP